MKSSKIWAVIPTAFIALLFAFSAHARITTIAWDPDPAWPAGTTIELEANGATESGITGTQYTLDVPVQPGEMINARARAVPPAGYQCDDPIIATWGWTIDETTEMTALADTISLATWDLASGLTPGVVVTTSVKSTIFITAPATPSDTPYRCTLTYTTAGGRVTLKAFWLYAVDPIRFSA